MEDPDRPGDHACPHTLVTSIPDGIHKHKHTHNVNRWIEAKPRSTDGRRSERPQMGAMASRVREGVPGRTASVAGAARVPSWGRAVGADRWIEAQARVGCAPLS